MKLKEEYIKVEHDGAILTFLDTGLDGFLTLEEFRTVETGKVRELVSYVKSLLIDVEGIEKADGSMATVEDVQAMNLPLKLWIAMISGLRLHYGNQFLAARDQSEAEKNDESSTVSSGASTSQG